MFAREVWTCGIVLLSALAPPLEACEILVRDAAFRTPRDTHRLCLMATSGDPDAAEIEKNLATWLAGSGKELNLTLERVDVDDPSVAWHSYGIPSAPPSVPVVVLVGTNQGAGVRFVVDHWEPGPTSADLQALANSPIREALPAELAQNLAVLLYAPRLDADDQAVGEVLQETVATWSERETLGVTVLRLNRDDPAERLLLSFAGVGPGSPDWVGIVFGRGKLMSPPLVGEDITTERLDEMLKQLTLECACSKPLPSMGVDVPLAWGARQEEILLTLGDPEAEFEPPPAPALEPEYVAVPHGPASGTDIVGESLSQPPSGSEEGVSLPISHYWKIVAAALVMLVVVTAIWRRG